MAKFKIQDEENEFIPVVQNVFVNNHSVFDGEVANIEIEEPDVNKEYVDEQVESLNEIIEEKQDTLISGDNIKTINSQSLLGEGNINIGAEAAYVPRGIIFYDSKMGDEVFIETIGGLDNLERIKEAARNRTPIVIGDSKLTYAYAIDVFINENYYGQYFFELILVFYDKNLYNPADDTIYTISISGRESSNFNVETTHLYSLLGQISVRNYGDIDYQTILPVGTSAYVQTPTNYATKGFVDYDIGEMIDRAKPNAYPITYDDDYLQSLTPEQLTSKIILTQGENEVIISYRKDPVYNARNIYDWQIIKRSAGEIVSNIHYIYINTYMGDYVYGWNSYNELTGELQTVDFFSSAESEFIIRHYIKSSVTPATISNYDVEGYIETSAYIDVGSYRYKKVLDPLSGIEDEEWVYEYPNVQPDFNQQDSLQPDYIHNKPSLETRIYSKMGGADENGVVLTPSVLNYFLSSGEPVTFDINTDQLIIQNNQVITFNFIYVPTTSPISITFNNNIVWLNGITPTFSSANNHYLFTFTSYDGGTTWIGELKGEW